MVDRKTLNIVAKFVNVMQLDLQIKYNCWLRKDFRIYNLILIQ